jgi:hypothetical protein
MNVRPVTNDCEACQLILSLTLDVSLSVPPEKCRRGSATLFGGVKDIIIAFREDTPGVPE